MIAPPLALLFPNARFVAGWVAAAIWLFIFVLTPTPSGFPATNGAFLHDGSRPHSWGQRLAASHLRQWEARSSSPVTQRPAVGGGRGPCLG